MSQKIVPNIWFNHDADDAGAYYADVFPGATATIGAKYPDDLDGWQADYAGRTLARGWMPRGRS